MHGICHDLSRDLPFSPSLHKGSKGVTSQTVFPTERGSRVVEAGRRLLRGVISSLICLNGRFGNCLNWTFIEMFLGGHGDIGTLEAWAVSFSFFVSGAQTRESLLPHTLI